MAALVNPPLSEMTEAELAAEMSRCHGDMARTCIAAGMSNEGLGLALSLLNIAQGIGVQLGTRWTQRNRAADVAGAPAAASSGLLAVFNEFYAAAHNFGVCQSEANRERFGTAKEQARLALVRAERRTP